MDQQALLKFLKRARDRMQDDYDNGREGQYPPLYTKDYVFGKLKATKEIISFLEITNQIN